MNYTIFNENNHVIKINRMTKIRDKKQYVWRIKIKLKIVLSGSV